MSKQKVIVLAVTVQGLSKAEAARRYGVSRQWVHELLTRYRTGGLDAVEARSRRPNSNPRSTGADITARILALRASLTDADITARILALRASLTDAGLDAGPVTIAWHLEREGLQPPRPPRSAASCTPQA